MSGHESYAVIFSSHRTDVDQGYGEMADRMVTLAKQQPGFINIESVRDGKFGITISYWESVEAIQNWKKNVEHLEAQRNGRKIWYEGYTVRICKMQKEYSYKS